MRLGFRGNAMIRMRTWRVSRALTLVSAAALGANLWAYGCAPVTRFTDASVRMSAYFSTHQEIPPSVADAIKRGHVIAGMDREQIVVVLGPPLKHRDYGGHPSIEVWLYQSYLFHQDAFRTHSASLFRLVFEDGYLKLIEPL